MIGLQKLLVEASLPGIIIPYRNRPDHINPCTAALSKFSKVYVIEQADQKHFNRGKLINCGYLHFGDKFEYFAANDVDLLPLAADYSYCENPCQLATQVEQFKWSVPYLRYMGGVTLIPNKKFEQVNGFSNSFWGYGGEDDELRRRFEAKSILIESRECKFQSLPHEINIDHDLRMKNVERLKKPIDWEDGLTSCTYEIVSEESNGCFTLLRVKI